MHLFFTKLNFGLEALNFFFDLKNKFLLLQQKGKVSVKNLLEWDFIGYTCDLIFIYKSGKGSTVVNFFEKLLTDLVKGYNQFFFFEYRIIGLGYKIFKLKRSLSTKMVCLKLGFAHYIQYMIPKNIRLFSGKRHLLVYSNNFETVKNLTKHFFFLKRLNVYKLKGLVPTKGNFRLKVKQKK